jgi:excisionase family DNA binding protein
MASSTDASNGVREPVGTGARPITRADVLRAVEVGQLLGVPKSTVEDWARRGVIPSRKRGKRRFFLRWEVERWLVAEDSAG